jgi:hypothetical protein
MPLSINKLSKLLSTKSMIVKSVYSIGGSCVYLDVMNINTGESLFLYIPSKYEIPSEHTNVHKLHYLEVEEDGSIPSDYAEQPEDEEIADKYGEINVNNTDIKNQKDIEKYLTSNYDCPVSLENSSKEDITEIKEIFRQLKRLKFCVKNVNYKLCIIYKYYFCCIKRDGTYECYSVENLNMTNRRRIIVTTDLESLYTQINTIDKDVSSIRRGIYKVLDRNQNKHISHLQKMMEYKTSFNVLSLDVIEQKKQYKGYLIKLEKMLSNILLTEKNIIAEIEAINEKYKGNVSIKTLHNDIEKNNWIHKKEEELSNITQIKQEIITNIQKIKLNLESLSLKIDQICFDNIVMMDTIIKNFESLRKI